MGTAFLAEWFMRKRTRVRCDRTIEGRPTGQHVLGGVNVGFITNRPAPPGRGISFWWAEESTGPGRVTIADSEIEVAGMRVAIDGTVVVAKGLNRGTFSGVGRLAPIRMTGSFTCG